MTKLIRLIGIIDSIDHVNKKFHLLGYGTYLGMQDKPIEGYDKSEASVTVGKVKLDDSGKEVWVDDYQFFSSKVNVENMITEYKAKDYEIITSEN